MSRRTPAKDQTKSLPVNLDKFHYGQRVRIVDGGTERSKSEGTIVEYELGEDRWCIMMDDGSGKMVRATNIETIDMHPESWVRYQVPGAEDTCAYHNTKTNETRYELPENADKNNIPQLLPQNAREFIFYIGERWNSLTQAYGEISQVAADLRPRESAALTAGASLDREDFIAACQELTLVQDGDPDIAAYIFDSLDIDGNPDRILTVSDFHAADRVYRSASNGAMGQVQAPLGLLMFMPELVPPSFKERHMVSMLSPMQQLMRLVAEEERAYFKKLVAEEESPHRLIH